MKKKLENMIGFQYSILFLVTPEKQGQKEMKKFDKWLKMSSNELYDSVNQKKVWLLRKTNFSGYCMVRTIWKLFGKRDEEYIK